MSKKYSHYQQAIRLNRWEYFTKEVLPFIAFCYDTDQPNEHCFRVVDTPKGNLTIYPKGDKIQLQSGRWISENIVTWLCQTVIKEKIKTYKEWLSEK